ncbi:polyprenyl synthetase family protein [Staphylococcus americanisciuri]|uniref:Polyprenyl synthetase family protein n=1 Tax=Staphylococcus americanisciuri TaxID=2973940 RepID=A0ABT2EZB8_9STAP|nr:farnesyl diphosphate synthase [Staphylococcus americanisciuri]MCS4485504.1 polyprenyl synthetase family protein [Staphylococcus americanisciuri]
MNQSLNKLLSTFNHILDQSIEQTPLHTQLEESMRYSLQAGGKRVRPLLLLATLHMLQPNKYHEGLKTAVALEMVHTYSLIHDDLPAMDNDDLRRGKPTNHKVYGEWLAILAGDALLTKAFEYISNDASLSAEVRVKLITALSQASGHQGMVGGQALDMQSESQAVELPILEQIHLHKTGALIRFAIEAAIIIANVDNETQQQLIKFANHLGIIFQIKDDLLDLFGTTEALGKQTGSDDANEKSTYATLLGYTQAEHILATHVEEAERILASLSEAYNTDDLAYLLKLFYQRQN